MNDLSALGGFFSPYVASSLKKVERKFPQLLSRGSKLAASLTKDLNRNYYELTHRTLIGHYKLIEKSVSFADFAAALDDEDTRAHLLTAYPVLARWMTDLSERWVRNVEELLRAFQIDRPELCRLSDDLTEACTLDGVVFGLGDFHRGGRSVASLVFSSGARLIFKPRSLACDAHFATVISKVRQWSGIDLRVPDLLPREDYGWVQFIEYRSCSQVTELDLYYLRLGALLAILYVLEASDFHYENIIACGSHPMLIDLEAICHPRTPMLGTETNQENDATVLRTGLLPRKLWLGTGIGADISGMTDVAGQEGVVERLVLVQSADGELSFKRDRGTLLGAQNVPMLQNLKLKNAADHIGSFVEGFARAYRSMSLEREHLLDLASTFSEDEVRIIFRPTLAYTHLLDEARHPAILMSEEAVRSHFENLTQLSLDYPILTKLIDDEIEALQMRDVPVFTCRAGDTDLIINGERVLPHFFLDSGVDAVRRRVGQLSEDDLQRQIWIIRKALELSGTHAEPKSKRSESAYPQSAGSDSSGRTLSSRAIQQAVLVGDLIKNEVYQDDRFANWLVTKPSASENGGSELWNASYDLYGGMPGEILFLDQLTRVTGNQQHRELADKALHYLQTTLNTSARSIRSLGVLGGWGSVIMLMTALGSSRNEPAHFQKAEEYIQNVHVSGLIASDTNYSLTKGAAGLIVACAGLHRLTGSTSAIALAEEAFQHLMAQRHDVEVGYGWRIASGQPLSGLAHGASGFALAFARLFQATGGEHYRSACLEALKYERTLYVPKERNWRDQRDTTLKRQGEICATTWAHGAPGIGLARLAILDCGITSAEIEQDLHLAIRTTLDADATDSISLISGDFGRLELPLRFAERQDLRYWDETLTQVDAALEKLETYTADPKRRHRVHLGLFNGATGAGYQCMRIFDNRRLPPIASLEVRPAEKALQFSLGAAPSLAGNVPRENLDTQDG